MKQNYVKQFNEAFFLVYKLSKGKLTGVLLWNSVATIIDNIGLLALTPILEIFLFDRSPTENLASSSILDRSLRGIFAFLDMEYTLLNLLIVAILIFFIKTLVLLVANFYSAKIRSEILFTIKDEGIKRLVNTDLTYISSLEKGSISNVLNEQANKALLAVTNFVKSAVFLINFVIYATFFIYVDSLLGMLSFVFGALIFTFFSTINMALRNYSNKYTRKGMEVEVLLYRLENDFKYFLITAYLGKLKNSANRLFRQFKDLYFFMNFYSSLGGSTKDLIILLLLCSIFAVNFLITGVFGEVVLLSILLMHRIFNVLFGVLISFQNTLVHYGSIYEVNKLFENLTANKKKLPVVAELNQLIDQNFTPKIELNQVSFRRANSSNQSISNVSFCIEPGEITALIGKSGSGKTTLADIVLGALTPTAGKVLYDGKSITPLDNFTSLKIGYLPQNPVLIGRTLRGKHNSR